MKLNSSIKLRIDTFTHGEIKKIAAELGFREGDLIRFLISTSLTQLQKDARDAGGIGKLEFTIRR